MRALLNGKLFRGDLKWRVAMGDRGCCGVPEPQGRRPGKPYKAPRSVKAGVLPMDHTSSPFHELELEELWKGTGRCRVRQHVNPLKAEYQTPSGPVNWSEAFEDPTLPLIIDLGCGPGRFLMLLHKRRADENAAAAAADQQAAQQHFNLLGIEIREPLVDRANEWAGRLGFKHRVHYVHSNATISLAGMLKDYPGQVDSVYIQFPDPHFKKRHRKRRIFQSDLVYTVRDMLRPGGQLFLQSDIEMAASAMRNCFEFYTYNDFQLAPQHSDPEAVFFSKAGDGAAAAAAAASSSSVAAAAPAGSSGPAAAPAETRHAAASGVALMEGSSAAAQSENSTSDDDEQEEEDGAGPGTSRRKKDDYDSMFSVWAQAGWLRSNPIGVPTEREHYVTQQGLPVYRVLLLKKQSQ